MTEQQSDSGEQPAAQQHDHQQQPHWIGQDWLLGQISTMLGAEDMLQYSCSVCRAWRHWCHSDITTLYIGNTSQRLRSSPQDSMSCAGFSLALFLPVVPSGLRELNLSGTWTCPTARELATIRRGCRLRKLVMTGVRLFSLSYRELLLFEHLQELDISASHLDVPLPRLRYAEPAGEIATNHGVPSLAALPPAAGRGISRAHPFIGSNPNLPAGAAGSPAARVPAAPLTRSASIASLASRRRPGLSVVTATAVAAAAAAARQVLDGAGSVCDSPRFAATLQRLTAVKTRLWNRWDLSTFPRLTALEVSFAGRSLLKELHLKAKTSSRLAEFSVCDLALRNLVQPTELQELAEAVGGASTFRLRRVDVVKEVPSFAYLRAILLRLENLEVLELTDVALDDKMVTALAGCLTAARPNKAVAGSVAEVANSSSRADGVARVGGTEGDISNSSHAEIVHGSTAGEGSTGGGGGSISAVRLRTLVLGGCEGVSQGAFETFFTTLRDALSGSDDSEGGGSGQGPGRGEGIDEATKDASVDASVALSRVRLRGCRNLGDRGLRLLYEGARDRLVDLQVTGSLHLTDKAVEAMAASCPRLVSVDVSGNRLVTSCALFYLLDRCRDLREVKAWGCRVASDVVHAHDQALSAAAEAQRLREAYQRKDVNLAWAGHVIGAVPSTRGRLHMMTVSPSSAGGGTGVTRRQRCQWGCGGSTSAGNSVDHFEVCPKAPVACVLQADGCTWRGTRMQRRRHLEECSAWLVQCPTCYASVHVTAFAGHVLGHYTASEALALHPPGCALRAYGCRTCRTTSTVTATARVGPPTAPTAVAAGRSSSPSLQALAAARSNISDRALDGEPDLGVTNMPAPAAIATAASATSAKKGDASAWPHTSLREGRVEQGKGAAYCRGPTPSEPRYAHDDPGKCPWFRVMCTSCQVEVGRLEWDEGRHVCVAQRRVNVLAKHASGAGMLRNRQWLQIVCGYMGSGAGKDSEDDPRDDAFHGVNPMCAMPSVLSAALPLPGPAGAPASPATHHS